jgi:hypothetical protein
VTTPASRTSSTSQATSRATDPDRDFRAGGPHGEETKPSWKTTELFIYLAAVIGVLIASQAVGDGGNEGGGDVFAADKAWWFITLLTIGYIVSRGLAKSGTRTRDYDPRTR